VRRLQALALLLAVGTVQLPSAGATPNTARAGGDAVVVAVIDNAFSPYHWDYLAARMPQHRNSSGTDDLPLTRPASEWLSGLAAADSMRSLRALPVTLEPRNPERPITELSTRDRDLWSSVKPSTADDVNLYWLPGTKVIAAASFDVGGQIEGSTGTHGTGTTSASVGNLNGTCPECLLVFLHWDTGAGAQRALEWALNQPWIDVVTNSWSSSTTGANDNVAPDAGLVGETRIASERGQTIFFAAGNGLLGGKTAPSTTLSSARSGPDWIVTVGGVSPDNDASYFGVNKPVDVASIAGDYFSGYAAETVSGRGPRGFGGTSNATPVVAGHYARALHVVRATLPGASRRQGQGVVAAGRPGCHTTHGGCELADGILTAEELRMRLLQSAMPTGKGYTFAYTEEPNPRVADTYRAGEGHGTYFGRLKGEAFWRAESRRVSDPLIGSARPPSRPDGEASWFVADSYCRQQLWGGWNGGYYRQGMPTADPDASAPTRTAAQAACTAARPFPTSTNPS
jgi:hypothetical protein